MNIHKVCLILLLFCGGAISLIAQDWDLEMETEEGILIYTRFVEGEPLKQVKIEFELESKLNPLVSLITNPAKYTDFVYKALNYEQKEGGPGNGLFYGQIDFPWPMADRDYYVQTETTQDEDTKMVTIETKHANQSAFPLADGFVRITAHHNTWKFLPTENGIVKGEYWLKSDPCGSIPQWAVNMMIHEGSVKTIQQLFKELANYQPGNPIAYIKEK